MALADRQDPTILASFLVALVAARLGSEPVREQLAEALGRLAHRLSRRKRRQAQAALDVAYGESLAADERQRIVTGSMREVWRELFTLVAGPAARPDPGEWELSGLERLDAALAKGRGVVLWESNGLGPRWLPKRILAERGYRIHQVHGDDHLGGLAVTGAERTILRARVLRPFVDRCEAYFLGTLSYLPPDGSMGTLRELRRRLDRNEIVSIAADGGLGQRRIRVPFLGAPTPFSTGMVSLARVTGAKLLPIFAGASRSEPPWVAIEGPIALDAGADRERVVRAALARYATMLDRYVRADPAAYRNWHLLIASREVPPV